MINIKELKETIEKKLDFVDKVIILPHNSIDYDAIGSALGLSLNIKKYEKEFFNLMNDPTYKIDYGVKSIIDDASKEFNIINRDEYNNIKGNDLYIVTDVNKKCLVSINDYLKNPDNIVIIDHHEEDGNTIESNNRYIDKSASSASEIVTKLLCNNKVKIPSNVANYLLAGIYLDTHNLTTNVTGETARMATKLIDCGANVEKVTELFEEDFVSDRKVQELVSNLNMVTYKVAILAASEDSEYTKEELAKAADYALKFNPDASFSIGKIDDDLISISARSRAKIDVGKVMSEFGGGGSPFSAAARLSDTTIDDTAKKLVKILEPKYKVQKENL